MNIIRCPKGHTYNSDDYEFCPHCVAEMQRNAGAGMNGAPAGPQTNRTLRVFDDEIGGTVRYDASAEFYAQDQGRVPLQGSMMGQGQKQNSLYSGSNQPEKKKKIWIPILIAAAVVLLIGGIVIWRLAANKDDGETKNTATTAKTVLTTTVSAATEKAITEAIPTITGIRIIATMNNVGSNEAETRTFTFDKDGGTLSARNTAVFQLEVQSVPDGAGTPEVTWTVSEPDCIEISNNVMNVLKELPEGVDSAVVTATTSDGKYSRSFNVEVSHAGWNKARDDFYFIKGNEEMYRSQWWRGSEYSRYLGSDGLAVSGWQQLKDEDGTEHAYYFNLKSKVLAVSTTISTDFGECTVNEKGELINSWLNLNGKWYYYDANGLMLKDTSAEIDGKTYSFGSDGTTDK